MASGVSLIPALGKEAAGAKVSVSLLLIVGIAWGAYTLGSKSSERIADVETALIKLTALAEHAAAEQAEMKDNQKSAMRDIRAIEDRTNSMNVELVELSARTQAKGKR